MSTHYIAMAGLHGYSPQCCEAFSRVGMAISYLAAIHELSTYRTRQLQRDRYLELNIHTQGNEYCEIRECSCDDPKIHSDSGEFV